MARKRNEQGGEETGRFAYEGLDRVMHEKARLGVLTSLSIHREGLLFNQLKELCALSDGNLSRHMQVLEEAGLVEIWKGFQGKRPQTLCRITPKGVARFQEYLRELENVIRDAAREEQRSKAEGGNEGEGWVGA